jgi:hypothetical protein
LTIIVTRGKMRRRMRMMRSLTGVIRTGRRRSEGGRGMVALFRVVVSFPALRIVA